MLITFVEPIVLSQDQFYKLNPMVPSSSVRIYVGFLSNNTNIATFWSLRNWFLRDIKGTTIQRGQVNIELNTYNSFVDLSASGLTPGTIYTFSIDNPLTKQAIPTTIISTIDTPSLMINVIDETFRFINMPDATGDVRVIPIGTTILQYGVQFSTNWNVARTEGNGLITSGDRFYAYAPTAIYTRKRDAPPYVDFVPFRGLSSKRIPIFQVPTIWNEGNLCYSIDPPTRVKVSWRQSISGQNADIYQSYDTKVAVLSVDVAQLAGEIVGGVKIAPVY